MTVKKMRRVAEEPSPSPSYIDDARKYSDSNRSRKIIRSFLRILNNLHLQETEEKKRRLLEARLRKRKLFAEARFLRRKLETLFANSYQQVRLKEPSSKTPVIKPPTEKKPRVSEAARTSNCSIDNSYANASQYEFKKMSQKKSTKSLCCTIFGPVLKARRLDGKHICFTVTKWFVHVHRVKKSLPIINLNGSFHLNSFSLIYK
ncbi:hypothetical protein ZIOFF_008678 [Zingiber officinale]|uniref:Uncharacterized protein n=1 Tax=Zingiber officinale TaxID=94328 RepID=A0A8J5LQZ0_ZINOF|nr:hypothetical protein ZIOFF_008678 [Zingiber officinale]